jgi:UDP-N-acetylmuramoylalanine--D-glutamate ligase
MKIAIIGYGVSGNAAERLARLAGYDIIIADDRITADYDLGYCLCSVEEIILSPGVPPGSELYQTAVHSGKPLISELEFGFRYCTFPLLAITGTNGKTTTTELCATLLRAAGYNAIECGNIGVPLSQLVFEEISGQRKVDVGVLEVSSFQLEKINTFSPAAAAIINIAEDHLDRYDGSIHKYAAEKFKIFNRIADDKCKITGSTLNHTPELIPPEHIKILNRPPGIYIRNNTLQSTGGHTIDLDALMLKGAHNHENIITALALIEAFCGSDTAFSENIVNALKNFNPGRHRIEQVAERDGVRFINDSKGTNPAAVLAALNTVGGDHNVCLLLGGLDKGMDFSVLRQASNFIKKAFIMGECRTKIYETLKDDMPCMFCSSFEKAVAAATAHASHGDIVLLSPGCASMDMFKNYQERGNYFTELVAD